MLGSPPEDDEYSAEDLAELAKTANNVHSYLPDPRKGVDEAAIEPVQSAEDNASLSSLSGSASPLGSDNASVHSLRWDVDDLWRYYIHPPSLSSALFSKSLFPEFNARLSAGRR